MALTNAFVSAVKSNIRRLGSSLSGGSLSDLGAAAQKINAEILNARNRTQTALRNLDEPYARSLAHRNGFDLNSQGQIISPASTAVTPRSGAVSQADIERAQAYHNKRLGDEIVERRAAEQAARRSEAARKGAATRKANREQAAADNHIYSLQAQANAALARQAARSTTVNAPDVALMREAVAGEAAREQNKKAFLGGVRDRQRAAVAAGQNARIDAHLNREVAGWEQLGENSHELNAVRGRQQAAYDAGQQVKANAAAERVATDKEYARSILQDNVAEINERARRAQAIASGNELKAKYKQAVADNYDKFWQEQLNKQDYISDYYTKKYDANYRAAQKIANEREAERKDLMDRYHDAQLDASVSKERKLIQEEANNGFTIEGYNEGAKQYTAATQVDGKTYDQAQNKLFAEQLDADEKRFKALRAAQNKVDAANAQKIVKQESTEPVQEATAAPVGSGETLGSSARSMLTRDKDGKLVMDEKAYRALDKSDMKTWGADKAQQYDINSLQRMVEKEREAIDKAPEKLRQAKMQELEDKLRARAERGYGIGDWIFGNQLHTGAIGAAAIAGTMGVAFGGHKSNAELYASPF